jgi:hypothetical protein
VTQIDIEQRCTMRTADRAADPMVRIADQLDRHGTPATSL